MTFRGACCYPRLLAAVCLLFACQLPPATQAFWDSMFGSGEQPATPAGSAAARGDCRDKSHECSRWRRNMAAHQGIADGPRACRGQDFEFMKLNCPATCELCDEARRRRDRGGRKKAAAAAASQWRDGVAEDCDWLRGSVWNWNDWRHVTFLESGKFDAPTADCEGGRCFWSCRRDAASVGTEEGDEEAVWLVQINWGDSGLHEVRTLEDSTKDMSGERVENGQACSAELVRYDLYRVLDIPRDAPAAAVRKAYRRLSLQYHPDKLPPGATDAQKARATERFDDLNEAYETLGDAERRAVYDSMGGKSFNSRQEFEREARAGTVQRARSFYADSSAVTSLSQNTFDAAVLGAASPPTMVEFYAPWCGHCQELAPHFKRAAILLEPLGVATAAVDCDASERLCRQLGVNGYPTLRFWPGAGGQQWELYDGRHEAEAIEEFVRSVRDNRVVSLDAEAFRRRVRAPRAHASTVWLVDFSAGAWCGPCTSLKPPLRQLANDMSEVFAAGSGGGLQVQVGIVDCDSAKALCEQLGVPHYPHLRVFSPLDRQGEALEIARGGGAGAMLGVFGTIMRHVAAAGVAGEAAGR